VPRPTRLDFDGGSDGQNSESGSEVPRSEKRPAPPPPDKRPEKIYQESARSDNVTKVPVSWYAVTGKLKSLSGNIPLV
jgi:hypothetical protein